MLRTRVLSEVLPDTMVKVQIASSLNDKGESLVLRVKSNNLVKRYVNRLYSRSNGRMNDFGEKLGLKNITGVHEVKFSELVTALKVFPIAEGKSNLFDAESLVFEESGVYEAVA